MLELQLVILGLAAGAATGASGIGWGVLTMPVLLGLLRFEPTVAVPLSVVAGIGYPLGALLAQPSASGLPVAATVALGVGSLLGGLLGAWLLPHLPPVLLRRLIAGPRSRWRWLHSSGHDGRAPPSTSIHTRRPMMTMTMARASLRRTGATRRLTAAPS